MGKYVKTILFGAVVFIALAFMFSTVSAQEDHPEETDDVGMGLKLIGAGLAVGLSGVGAGIGEASVGAAAVGAMAEDPKMFGKGLLMTVIPETIVIFGLLVAFMIIGG